MLDDETLGCCPIGPRLLAYGLIHIADDDGRFRASPTFLKARVFAYNDDLSPAEVAEWLNHLAGVGFIVLYRDSEQSYGVMPKWRKHQRIDKPSPSLLPDPGECEAISAVLIPGAFGEHSTNPREPSPNPPGTVASVPTYSHVLATPHQQRDSGQFDERSANALRVLGEPSPPEGKGMEGNGRERKGKTSIEHPDFDSWLTHHNAITGQRTPREGTASRADIAAMYAARRSEGYTAEELCLATVGAFNDPYRRENGHYGCVSVLRPKKVHDLIEKGRRPKPIALAQEHPTSRRIREIQELRERLRAEEEAAA
jgi:hypothetical protein